MSTSQQIKEIKPNYQNHFGYCSHTWSAPLSAPLVTAVGRTPKNKEGEMTKPTKHAGEWATLHAAGTPLASYLPRPGTFISRAGQENCTGESGNNKAPALDDGNRLLELLP